MKLLNALMLLTAIVLVSGEIVRAQDSNDPNQTLANLRWQLTELQDREANLKSRLQELEFDIKPENIERYFSGVGSTRPEELRENRRRQLQSEKERVVAQLNQLTSDRSRLEAAIANAEAQVYQGSALGLGALKRDPNASPAIVTFGRVLLAVAILVMGLGVLVLVIAKRRQRRMQQ